MSLPVPDIAKVEGIYTVPVAVQTGAATVEISVKSPQEKKNL